MVEQLLRYGEQGGRGKSPPRTPRKAQSGGGGRDNANVMCLNVADIDRVSKELRKTVVGTTRTEWTLAKIVSEFQAFQAVDGHT